jgi:hypothetical protein
MQKLPSELVEAKVQQLKQLTAEAEQLKNELKEAGAWPLDDETLDDVSGGRRIPAL